MGLRTLATAAVILGGEGAQHPESRRAIGSFHPYVMMPAVKGPWSAVVVRRHSSLGREVAVVRSHEEKLRRLSLNDTNRVLNLPCVVLDARSGR